MLLVSTNHMQANLARLLALALALTALVAAQGAARALRIYVIDVEGGNAQLWVSPSGESIVIDTGNGPGPAAVRDADRIMAAVKDAGVSQIDHLITTHFHGDHVGGLIELAARIPIRDFIDHGPNVQRNAQMDEYLRQYAEIYARATHTVPKTGDRIPVTGVDWRIVSITGRPLKTPLSGAPGAGRPNPYCERFVRHDVNPVSGGPLGNTEDEQSVASLVTFGKFRALYLGDFDWNQEFELMCPTNTIGTVDLFIASRHGQPSSNSELLVHAVRPRAIVMNNGPRKGGQPPAMNVFLTAPRLEDIWQIHFALLGGQEYAVPGLFIANTEEVAVPVAPVPPPARGSQGPPAQVHNGPAHWIKVSAQADGGFTVTNGRNDFSKTYQRVSKTH